MAKPRTRRAGHRGAMNVQDFATFRDHMTDDERVRLRTFTAAMVFLSGFSETAATEYERVTGNPAMGSAVHYLRDVFGAERSQWESIIFAPGTVRPGVVRG